MHPAFYTGPRMVKPPVVYNAGLLRRSAAAIDTTVVGVARPARPASSSSTRRTSAAGTTRAGSTPPPGAPAGSSRARSSRTRSTGKRPEPNDPAKLVDAALAFWGYPTLAAGTHARCSVRPHGVRRRAAQRGSAADPPIVETALRALIADLPRPPDRMNERCLHCDGLRARGCCAARSPRRAAGCPRSSRGCRCPPGPGSRAGRFLAARASAPARGLRRRAARAAPSRTASPRAAVGTAGGRCSSPSTSRAGSTRCRCSPRRATRCTTSCGRTSRSPGGTPFTEDAACAGTRPPAGSRSCTARGRSR